MSTSIDVKEGNPPIASAELSATPDPPSVSAAASPEPSGKQGGTESTEAVSSQPSNDLGMKVPETSPPPPEVKSAPKKRLTLQERLALAASTKKKPNQTSSTTNTPSVVASNFTNAHSPSPVNNEKSSELVEKANSEEPEASKAERIPLTIPDNLDSMEKESLINLLKSLGTEIKKNSELKESEIKNLQRDISSLKQQNSRKLNAPGDVSMLTKKLQDKENQIKELLEEGAKLSTKEVNLTQQIKKMKQREMSLEDQLDGALQTIDNLNIKVKEKTEEVESIKEMERGIKEERLQNEALQMKFDKLQKEYDVVYNELKEIKFRRLDVQLTSTKKQLEEETKSNEELSARLEKLSHEYDTYKSKMKGEVAELELQLHNERTKFNNAMEDNMNEIKRLENKMESLRLENESSIKYSDTSDSSTKAATNSSSMSLDLVQLQYTQAQENWKLIESTYLKRIASIESDLSVLKQKDINNSKKIKTLTNDLKNRQAEISDLMDSETIVMSQLETTKKELQDKEQELVDLKESYVSLQKDFENEKVSFKKQIDVLEEDKERLANISKLKIDTPQITQSNLYLSELNSANTYAYYKSQRSVSSISIDNIGLGESSTTPRPGLNGKGASFSSINQMTPNNSYSLSRMISSDHILEEHQSPDFPAFESPSVPNRQRYPSESNTPVKESPYAGSASQGREIYRSVSYTKDDLGQGSTIAGGGEKEPNTNIQMMNKLSSHIRRLEIELMSLKEEVESLSKQKAEASKEIVRLLKENSEVTTVKEKLKAAQEEAEELSKSYEATLLLLGAKSEKVEELKADVMDLKDICRQQAQEMVEIQERLTKK